MLNCPPEQSDCYRNTGHCLSFNFASWSKAISLFNFLLLIRINTYAYICMYVCLSTHTFGIRLWIAFSCTWPFLNGISFLIDVKTLLCNKLLSIFVIFCNYILFYLYSAWKYLSFFSFTVSGYWVTGKKICFHFKITKGFKVLFKSLIQDIISCRVKLYPQVYFQKDTLILFAYLEWLLV